ncbi:MAG: PCRF domain-containing protein [Candidatus Pacebacteria bacterium]|nr:PCRF domain-containing protein [Candidatus Paceibacterota bacterium]
MSSNRWSNVFDTERFDFFSKEIVDLKEMLALGLIKTSEDEDNFSVKIASLEKELFENKKKIFLNGKYDGYGAILTIKPGAGGRDAQDWAAMLLRMYQKYCERKKWLCKILSQNFAEGGGPEGRIGIKEVVLVVKGEMAYGLLKRESGGHRLVRISPFSAKKLRHTSFAQVEVIPQLSNETVEVSLKPEDLKIETFRSAGHGGQNVNKRETAVRLTHLPTGLAASSQIERTQIMNKKIALNFLLAKLAALRESERQQELRNEKSKIVHGAGDNKKSTADFGGQIRSYVLHPYKLVKDHRTECETSNTEAVLNGDLECFVKAEIEI